MDSEIIALRGHVRSSATFQGADVRRISRVEIFNINTFMRNVTGGIDASLSISMEISYFQ